MQNCDLMPAETPGASQEGTLAIELFLMENYRFRRNILNGKVEFAILPKADNKAEGNTVDNLDSLSIASEEAELDYRPLTQAALNSIVIRAKRENILEKGSPKTEITEYVQSEEVPEHNPVQAFLNDLPKWDGQNHIAKVFGRIPGITSEQLNYLTIWLRSAVAHWLQLDMLHGNECVPTLIGAQGCGKTTFVRRLLPVNLREYYLDHLNLANKFDKEMALTNNLFVNLDELDAIRPSQQSSLKQTLSVSKVNGRPIFGKVQEDRPRFDIDYDQLYAQVVYELRQQHAPYWFNNDEVARIQQLNQDFMEKKDIGEMFEACFRRPNEGEAAKTMNCGQLIGMMQNDFPTLENTIGNKVRLGKIISALGFEHKERSHVAYYKVVPLRAA